VWSSRSAGARKAAASASGGGEENGEGGGAAAGGGETIGVLRRRVDALSERVGKALQVVDVARWGWAAAECSCPP
jgi:hypothetical protein